MSDDAVVLQTRAWVKNFIVAHNICPFARKEFEADKIGYERYDETDLEGALIYLIELFQKMDDDEGIETTLLILPNGFSDFELYLELLDFANRLLVQQRYEGVYQLASFHPNYCFEGVDAADASHYTNRSPYPMLHVIREEPLERALERYPNPEEIPERNVEYCQELGAEKLEEILQGCRHAKEGVE